MNHAVGLLIRPSLGSMRVVQTALCVVLSTLASAADDGLCVLRTAQPANGWLDHRLFLTEGGAYCLELRVVAQPDGAGASMWRASGWATDPFMAVALLLPQHAQLESGSVLFHGTKTIPGPRAEWVSFLDHSLRPGRWYGQDIELLLGASLKWAPTPVVGRAFALAAEPGSQAALPPEPLFAERFPASLSHRVVLPLPAPTCDVRAVLVEFAIIAYEPAQGPLGVLIMVKKPQPERRDAVEYFLLVEPNPFTGPMYFATASGEIGVTIREDTGPGKYPLRPKTRVLDFIKAHGGPTDRADMEHVQLINQQGEIRILDLRTAIKTGALEYNPVMQPHDFVHVPKRKEP